MGDNGADEIGPHPLGFDSGEGLDEAVEVEDARVVKTAILHSKCGRLQRRRHVAGFRQCRAVLVVGGHGYEGSHSVWHLEDLSSLLH